MNIYSCIQKSVCAFLLATLVFNWCGYRILAFYLEQKAGATLQAQFDKDEYDHSALISVKIPSPNLPYYHSSKEFYDMEGEIEMGGVFYKFVKRRLYNDTLEFLCLPNKEAMNLNIAKNDFYKRVNDLQQNNPEKKTQSQSSGNKVPSGEYFLNNDYISCELFFSEMKKQKNKNSSFLSCFKAVPDKPPQLG
jgi:hypothetical protein